MNDKKVEEPNTKVEEPKTYDKRDKLISCIKKISILSLVIMFVILCGGIVWYFASKTT